MASFQVIQPYCLGSVSDVVIGVGVLGSEVSVLEDEVAVSGGETRALLSEEGRLLED